MNRIEELLQDPKFQGIPKKVLKRLDGHALAIFRLKVHGIMTEKEHMNAWVRLVALTKREIKKHTTGNLKS